MKKYLIGIILGILITFLISASADDLLNASDVSYSSSTEEISTVKDALDDLYSSTNDLTNINGGIIFTSSPVDMSQYTDDWANLVADDFKAGYSNITATAYSSGGSSTMTSGSQISDAKITSTFKYDSSTGQLTFSNSSYNKSYTVHPTYNTTVHLTMTGTTFVVWLGTVGGQ